MRYITFPTTLVLQAIADGVRYGFDIADRTGLQTGPVYPALRRLDMLGYVRSSWESEKVARREQRPARRYYEITKAGSEALEIAIKRFQNLGRVARERNKAVRNLGPHKAAAAPCVACCAASSAWCRDWCPEPSGASSAPN